MHFSKKIVYASYSHAQSLPRPLSVGNKHKQHCFHVKFLTCSAGLHLRNGIPWHNKGPLKLEQDFLTKPSVHASILSHVNFLNGHTVPAYTSLKIPHHPGDKKLWNDGLEDNDNGHPPVGAVIFFNSSWRCVQGC